MTLTGRPGLAVEHGDAPGSKRRRLLAVGALVLVATGAAIAVTNPFADSPPAAGGTPDNASGTSLRTVMRQTLTSQTQVDGTLGYAGTATINLPAGTPPSTIRQDEQTLTATRQALASAQATLADDRQTLTQAQSQLTTDRTKERSECAGASAAQSSPSDTNKTNGGGATSTCASAAQTVRGDEATVSSAAQKATGDDGQAGAAQTSVTNAEQNLSDARASEAGYDQGAVYTMLPQAGAIIRRGHALFAIDTQPTLLLYGPLVAWRAFRPGMTPGRDVAQLNRNLQVLGYGHDLAGAHFTAATALAVAALQAANGLPQTGVLRLGAVIFKPGGVRVTSAGPTVGQAVQPGPVLHTSSTRHQVAIALDAAEQSQIRVGEPVVVTLPDTSRTPGVVSKVGKVASAPPGDQGDGGSSTPTIEVDVRLKHEAAAGTLDRAPVSVSVTTASAGDVLVVPVNSLLALAGGGYAVEIAQAGGAHHLVAVTLGLFDDADGLVQVTASGLHTGQHVVVPGS